MPAPSNVKDKDLYLKIKKKEKRGRARMGQHTSFEHTKQNSQKNTGKKEVHMLERRAQILELQDGSARSGSTFQSYLEKFPADEKMQISFRTHK